MMTNKTKSLITLTITTLSLFLLAISCIAADYELNIIEDSDIVWEYTEYNETRVEYLVNNEGYSSNYLNYEKGYQIRWQIESVDLFEGTKDYWEISYYFYEGEDIMESEDYVELRFCSVAKDPEELAEDWTQGGYIDYSIVILPGDVEDYLEEFVDAMDSNQYSINKRTLTIEDANVTNVIKYNKEGLQEEHTFYYNGKIALAYELEGVYTEEAFPYLFIIIIAILIIFSVSVAMIFLAKRNTKVKPKASARFPSSQESSEATHNDQSNQSPTFSYSSQEDSSDFDRKKQDYSFDYGFESEEKSSQPQKEAKIIGYCDLCGYERDSDAKFCPGCGQKFED